MTRILTGGYTPPSPAGHLAGLPIIATYPDNPSLAWDRLLEAANFVLARHHAKSVITQAWGDDVCQQTAVGFTSACRWKVPRLSDRHTSVRVAIRAERRGGGGTVRFQSTEGANTLDLAAPAAEGWVTGAFPLAFDADGYDIISMSLAGDGKDPVVVHSVGVQWEALTSPLEVSINGEPVWDIDEATAGRPLPTARGFQLLKQLEEVLARRQVYWNWSGLENSSHPDASWAMDTYNHQVPVPIHLDTELRRRKLRAHVHASGIVGEVSTVYLRHGERSFNLDDRTSFDVGIEAAAAWYNTHTGDIPDTVQLPQPDADTPIEDAVGWLGIWPGEETTANVHSVLVEGV